MGCFSVLATGGSLDGLGFRELFVSWRSDVATGGVSSRVGVEHFSEGREVAWGGAVVIIFDRKYDVGEVALVVVFQAAFEVFSDRSSVLVEGPAAPCGEDDVGTRCALHLDYVKQEVNVPPGVGAGFVMACGVPVACYLFSSCG